MKKKQLILMLFIGIIFAVPIFSISITPLVIELEGKPGDTIQSMFRIIGENDGGIVSVSVHKGWQDEEGMLDFSTEETYERNDIPNWFEIKSEVSINPYQVYDLPFTVNIPFTAKGTHAAVVLVEPDTIEAAQSLMVQIRFVLLVIIRVRTSGQRTSFEVDELDFKVNELKDQLSLEVNFENDSLMDYFISMDASIRDSNGRIVERLHMFSQQERDMGNSYTWLLPGSKIYFRRNISKIYAPGEYKIHLFINFGGKQRIVTKVLSITAEEFGFPEPKDLLLTFEHPYLGLDLKAKSVKTQLVQVKNMGKESVNVSVEQADLKENYERSLIPWIKMRGLQYFELGSGRSNRLAITFTIPKDVEEGSYYGKLVYTASDEATSIISKDFILGVTIGEPTLSATAIDFQSELIDNENLITLLLYNDGNTHFSDLKGNFSIVEKLSGETISSGLLEPSREEWIFPGDTVSLFGNFEGELPPNDYLVLFKIFTGNDLLIQRSIELTIEPKEQLAAVK